MNKKYYGIVGVLIVAVLLIISFSVNPDEKASSSENGVSSTLDVTKLPAIVSTTSLSSTDKLLLDIN